jgi:hypothetical protein
METISNTNSQTTVGLGSTAMLGSVVRVANDVARCNGGRIKGNMKCAKCKRSYAFSGAYGYWIDPAIKGDECPNFLPS